MLGRFFFINQSIFDNRNNSFFKLSSIEDIDSLKSNLTIYFNSDHFLLSFGCLKIANLGMLWNNICAVCRF